MTREEIDILKDEFDKVMRSHNEEHQYIAQKAADTISELQNFVHVARISFSEVLDGDSDALEIIREFMIRSKYFECHMHSKENGVI